MGITVSPSVNLVQDIARLYNSRVILLCIQKNIEKRIEPEIAMINTEENEGGQKLLYQLLGLWAN